MTKSTGSNIYNRTALIILLIIYTYRVTIIYVTLKNTHSGELEPQSVHTLFESLIFNLVGTHSLADN